MNTMEWARGEYFGNSILVWAVGAGVFLLVWGVLLIVRRVLTARVGRLAEDKKFTALDIARRVLDATKGWFLFIVAVFAGSRAWQLSTGIDTLIVKGVVIALLIQAGLWGARAALTFIEAKREAELHHNRGAVAAMDILSFVVRVVVWAFVFLLVLDNLDVNVTTLVAGLGIGGIDVALAAQSAFSDLFASLSIVLDKPFVVGDFLIIDQHLGTVERVGVKTTRVRSLSGEQLVFSNNDLLGSRIRNFGRMFERRVVFSLGVTYQTSAEHLKAIPEIIREAIEAQEHVRFDRAHFQRYGDFALVFESVYYVLSPEYNTYMDIQQAVNLQIFEKFAEVGIQFAYPTQTLFVNRTSADAISVDSAPDR